METILGILWFAFCICVGNFIANVICRAIDARKKPVVKSGPVQAPAHADFLQELLDNYNKWVELAREQEDEAERKRLQEYADAYMLLLHSFSLKEKEGDTK